MRNLIIALFIISSIFYVFFYSSIYDPLKMVFKLIPMLLIILLVILSKAPNVKTYKGYVLIGLIFCAIGDYTLQWFIVGLISFLIGHLFYIRAFSTTKEQEVPLIAKILLIIYGLVMALVIAGALIQSENMVLAIAVLCYIFVILTMGWTSFRTGSKFAMIGAFLFIISDSVLAVNKFVVPVDFSHQLIMTTYYGAQIFLALSIVNYSAIKGKGVQ